MQPWLGGSVGWSIIPYAKRSWVRFPIRAHTWVVVSIPGQCAYRKQPIEVSLSPYLSLKRKIRVGGHCYGKRTRPWLYLIKFLAEAIAIEKLKKKMYSRKKKKEKSARAGVAQWIEHGPD